MSSGHNPHSRLSQPVNSSSWNHLQVPSSYMPRQPPQLAHMSSERTLRTSPLIWPNTNPADAFYNYMALTAAAAVANSNPKNTTLDMNPLLPFVRTPTNPMPFSSVDLSLSATTTNTNRNSLTPSPRNYPVSSSPSTSNNRFAIKSTADEPDDSTNNKIDDNNKLNTDPIAFLSEMSEQLASMRTNRNLATSSTIPRDTNNLNSDLPNFRINGGNEKSKQRNEPMELGREANAAANLFENESLTNSVHLQQLLGLTPPITSSITPNLNDLSKSLLSMFNNTASPSPMLISSKSQSNFHTRQPDTGTAKNCLNISNDDSLDSQSGTCNGDDGIGRRYRRRKPQKTVRMSNEMNATAETSTLESEKPIKNDCHSKSENTTNGINFPTFHSDATANILTPSPLPPSTTTIVQPPQTQSMDLSHHCTNPEMFENGLVNYSKANDLNMANSTVGERCDKDANLMQTDEMNGLNLFGAFGHLSRVANLTNDIATFPNTDDLVKKVEELVKCNEQNGFGSNTNKLVSDAYENSRIANGISMETIKSPNNTVEHANKNTIKCNGNGVIPGMIQTNLNDKIENKTHENSCHDEVKMSTATPSNSEQNCEIACITSDKTEQIFEATNSIDLIYDKQTNNDINNHSNIDVSSVSVEPNATSTTVDNAMNNETTNKFNGDDVAKCTISASSSESQPSNASPTPKNKATATKKKATNQRCNGKMGKQTNTNNKTNQKNAKSNEKSEKKSDIKKTKTKDDSLASETLNKFRGPYVHVDRDGSVNVINAPLNEEIAEKQSKFKKNYISQRPADRNRVRGLHVSTLSNKYDAITTDISWMCVFCKLGPHKYGLGDLFGPFILSTESEDFQLAQIDPKNDVFKSSWHRNRNNMAFMQNISAVAAKSLTKTANAGNQPVTSVKKKRKLNQLDNGTTSNSSGHAVECNAQHNEIDIFYGMTRATDTSYEVWAHEDCIVWASGVHIIGSRVVGLETAVWGSVRHQCGICKQYGAMLSCLQRNCNNEVHVPCAKRCDWNLDEHCFQSRCSEHASVNDSIDENN
ncbi:putative uncharacterized protein DDB_G0282133 isoform X2 [Contarinia nasturtii]|uniref:putative uncharacterized protein DDB_G0282133 isoform X2 n=1 Tax=Contarinia nasturtii TaxID=265458 RepID=UPI0012D4BFFF|nr:putative uncharacterized protein DDB_G0282133 isoform X2 [Contarinia nasturtii]